MTPNDEGPESLRNVEVPTNCTITRRVIDVLLEAADTDTGAVDLGTVIQAILGGFIALEALIRDGEATGD